MTRPYNPRRFFRQAPNSMLEQYFKSKGVLESINFKELTETKIDPIYNDWLALPEKVRNNIERDFREIDFMAMEGGVKAIIDEANFHIEELGPRFSKLKSHHDRAFWTFLNRPEYWKGAILFHHADNISTRYWRKRRNIPNKNALVKPQNIRRLEQSISNYFHRKEGRGRNCRVECYKRNELDYLFAYPEDYAQASIEWIDSEFERLPRTPAFEVIFVYSQVAGTLDIFLRGSKDPIAELQKTFVEIILNAKLRPDEKDQKVYHLNLLKEPDFQFVFDRTSGIEEVLVRKLRLTSKDGNKDRITLEASPMRNDKAVYDLLDKLRNPSMRLANYNITQVGLTVLLTPENDRLLCKTRSFDISFPNSCNLKQDGKDLIIRKMLAESGLEPLEKTTIEENLPEVESDTTALPEWLS